MLDPIKKLFRIGEIMRYTHLSRQTIHNYTVMGLIVEAERTDGRHRLYGEETFEKLARIEEMKSRGMTLRQIRETVGTECVRRVNPQGDG